MEKETQDKDGSIYIGSRDFSNFLGAYIKGYRFLHGNKEPVQIIVPRVLFVDKVLIEYEKKEVKRENKSVEPK